jgi:hypothetical protein
MRNNATAPALIVIKGPAKDKLFLLGTNLVTVGRGETADIQLPGDTSISRTHFEIRLANGHYVLTNRSDNGTLINDKLNEEKQLQNGDRIRLGDVYVLEFSDGSKPAVAPAASLFRKPWILAGAGIYIVAMIALFVALSGYTPSADKVNAERIAAVLNDYSQYLNTTKIAKEEQESRLRVVQPYLRAGFIAEREGNYREARQVYLRVLDYTKDSRSPVYSYALERLRNVPATGE